MQNKDIDLEKDTTKSTKAKKYFIRPSKECAYIAIFISLLIVSQIALSFVPGVEIVTLLFVSYCYVFGVKRGIISATLFSVLRCIIFGFFPNVIILYLVYYNLLAITFGLLKNLKMPKYLFLIIIIATLCTISFTLLDDIITPLMFSYSDRAIKVYFYASFSFMIPQTICTTISVGILFFPLQKAFKVAKKGLVY